MAKQNAPPRRSRRYVWPAEAASIAQKKQHPVRSCEELIALTGHNKAACWRFLNKHGVERPGASSRHVFSQQMVESITEYVSEHGVQAASQRFHCSPKTLYNVLHRHGYTCRTRDMFSLAEICNHLRVKYSKVLAWIEQGLLLAHRETTRTGRPRYFIDPNALHKFCKEHKDLLVTRRWSAQRLAFLEEFVFAPKHADLLRTRESKREHAAFERKEYREAG